MAMKNILQNIIQQMCLHNQIKYAALHVKYADVMKKKIEECSIERYGMSQYLQNIL